MRDRCFLSILCLSVFGALALGALTPFPVHAQESPASLLTAADALRDGGDDALAALSYISLAEDHAGTDEASQALAAQETIVLGWLADGPSQGLLSLVAGLPEASAMSAAEKVLAMHAAAIQAERLQPQGLTAARVAQLTVLRDTAGQFIADHSASPFLQHAIGQYLNVWLVLQDATASDAAAVEGLLNPFWPEMADDNRLRVLYLYQDFAQRSEAAGQTAKAVEANRRLRLLCQKVMADADLDSQAHADAMGILASATLLNTSADTSAADLALADADAAQTAEGDVAAFLDYADLLDAYPDTAAGAAARSRHGALLAAWIAADEVPPALAADMAALAALPMEGSGLTAARKVLRMHYHGIKAHRAALAGDAATLETQTRKARAAAWAVLREHPDSPLAEMALESLLGATLTLKDATGAELDELAGLLRKAWHRMNPPAKNVALQVWSSHAYETLSADGKAAAAPYFAILRKACWKAMKEHPEVAPLQVNATGFYVAAAMQLPEDKREAAYARLAELVESHEPCVMTWFGRYELATVLARRPLTEEEALQVYRHHETILAEMDEGYMDAALDDASVDERTKGMLVAMLGHAHAGVGQLDQAIEHYDFVLANYGGHVHTRELAEYSKVVIQNARAGTQPGQAVAAYDAYVSANPDSSFLAEALLNAGGLLLAQGDTAGARTRLERVLSDRPNTPEAERAQALLSGPAFAG